MSSYLYLSKSTDSTLSQDVTVENKYARLLRPFQIAGVRYLYNKFINDSGALLNDDSGLGKTVQTVLFLTAVQLVSSVRTLILCHNIDTNHWLFHFSKWSSAKATLFSDDISDSTFVIALLIHWEKLSKLKWDIIVIDDLDVSLIIKQLSTVRCKFKLWLSNDNLQAQSNQLYKILNWVSGSKIGTQNDFKKLCSSEDEQLSERWKLKRCLDLFCNHWMLRRSKSSVADQGPIDTSNYDKHFSEWLAKPKSFLTGAKECNDIPSTFQPMEMIPDNHQDEDESSPSILDCSSFLRPNKRKEQKRKGKDDTGLKIKRSKPVASTNNESATSNDCVEASFDVKVVRDPLIFKEIDCLNIKKEVDNSHSINMQIGNDSRVSLLDSLFSSNYIKVENEIETIVDDNSIAEKNSFSLRESNDHSKIDVGTCKQFRLLENLFFS